MWAGRLDREKLAVAADQKHAVLAYMAENARMIGEFIPGDSSGKIGTRERIG
jgi:hypothetical protein